MNDILKEWEALKATLPQDPESVAHSDALVLAARFMSEIERVVDAHDSIGTKKELAEAIGTSPSYVTQLFRGDKLPNMQTLAKLEKALGIRFDVHAKPALQEESRMEWASTWHSVMPDYHIQEKPKTKIIPIGLAA